MNKIRKKGFRLLSPYYSECLNDSVVDDYSFTAIRSEVDNNVYTFQVTKEKDAFYLTSVYYKPYDSGAK